MAEVPELSPAEFVQRWPNAPKSSDVVLLDVREPDEVDRAAVDGAYHIPMTDVPDRLDELPKQGPIVVMCHLGGRSRRVAEFLAGRGYERVFNLRGGIDAWSRDVDRSVPQY